MIRVTTHTGGVDWNYFICCSIINRIFVTTHTGGVDWNCYTNTIFIITTKSPPTRVVWIEISRRAVCIYLYSVTTHTGGVDWNIVLAFLFRKILMSPPTRVVWIEIMYKPKKPPRATGSPPTRVVWIEIMSHLGCWCSQVSPPTRVVWIEIPLLLYRFIWFCVTTHTGGVDWNIHQLWKQHFW